MKSKTKILLGSALTIAMCASLITGSTLALFTSEAKTNIAVTSGKVDVDATIGDLHTYSYTETSPGTFESTAQDSGKFIYGTATLDESNRTLTLDKIVPGDKAEFDITLTNNSTVAIKYQIMMTVEGDEGFYKALDVSLGGEEFIDSELSSMKLSKWKGLDAEGTIPALTISIELPYTYEDKIVDGNEAGSIQGKTCTLTVAVQAVQGNAHTTDPVDLDDPSKENLVPIYSLNEFKTFRDRVNNGTDYAGKTVVLMDNIDLSSEANWKPIGISDENSFIGEFDGGDHIISGLNITAESNAQGVGLFGFIGRTSYAGDWNASVHNLTLKDVTINAVKAKMLVGSVAGSVYSNGGIKDLTVSGTISIKGGENTSLVGGIFGRAHASLDGLTVNAEPESMIEGGDQVGGLIGYIADSNYTLRASSSNVDVKALNVVMDVEEGTSYFSHVGGAVGTANVGTVITDVTVNATVTNESSDVYGKTAFVGIGGIVGSVTGKITLTGSSFSGMLVKYEDTCIGLFHNGLIGSNYQSDDDYKHTMSDNSADFIYRLPSAYVDEIGSDYYWRPIDYPITLTKTGERTVALNSQDAFINFFQTGMEPRDDNYKDLVEGFLLGTRVSLKADVNLENVIWFPSSIGRQDTLSLTSAAPIFNGNFDGENHIIRNLKVDSGADEWHEYAYRYAGLFGYLDASAGGVGAAYSAMIQNFTLVNPSVATSHSGTAGLVAGSAYGYTFENIHISGTVNLTAKDSIGGIVGELRRSKVMNCSIEATDGLMESENCVAGIAGKTEYECAVTGCKVSGLTMKSPCGAGGIVGFATSYGITVSGNTVEDVTLERKDGGSNHYFGSIAGYLNYIHSGTYVISGNTVSVKFVNYTPAAIGDRELAIGYLSDSVGEKIEFSGNDSTVDINGTVYHNGTSE